MVAGQREMLTEKTIALAMMGGNSYPTPSQVRLKRIVMVLLMTLLFSSVLKSKFEVFTVRRVGRNVNEMFTMTGRLLLT